MAVADPIARLVKELARLPGIGEKTAQRLAFHVLEAGPEYAEALAAAVVGVVRDVRCCSVCQTLTDRDPCSICADERRDARTLCVVEGVPDLVAIERSREFRGRYHVLHGALSPLDGVGPSDLKIRELVLRLEREPADEVVIATNPDVEGEATALYLAKLLKPLGVRVTRIAQGVPMGGDLEYADQVTLARALAGRREL
ncbi:MAG TPA: recombination mediator RecR [Anaeromyxobacteraceae bacterium]|nr:recombination mediator RecR [Anaeromyxobacteraceae bacterium]